MGKAGASLWRWITFIVEETTIATPERSDIHIGRITPLWVANGLRDIDPGMDAKSNNATSSSGLLPSIQFHFCCVDRGHHALLVAASACNKTASGAHK